MNRSTDDYLNILNMYGFYSLIAIPTRIRIPSITLIDRIFTDMMFPVNSLNSVAFFKDITDHFPVFCIPQNMKIESTDQFILKRSLKIQVQVLIIFQLVLLKNYEYISINSISIAKAI